MKLIMMITIAMAFLTFGLVNILATVNIPIATAASVPNVNTHLNAIVQDVAISAHLPRDTSIHWYIFSDYTTNLEYCIPWPNTIHFSNDTCLPKVDDCYALREWYSQPTFTAEFMYVTNFWDSPIAAPPQTWVTVHTINTCQLQIKLSGNVSSAFVSAIDMANRVNQSVYAGQFEGQDMLASSGSMLCSHTDDGSTVQVDRAVEWWMGCASTSAEA